ncbi:methyl-accepting chemotaxis protein [Hungatella hathewayi]|uniref:methyl-accepting chemotaxis protein n=1 Tax=Hungatella hathewayi TaxID=154046 RepID=UPI00210B7676|nr:methyl-accepting chemotaxis protein [Hungatella hathewayi]MCQ5386234.1 methyl-accepting chemotaxis protein [Hungatella hathewayi]
MLKNIKIRTRMLLSYAVIILLGLSVSVAALIMMDQISGNLTVFYENNYAVTVKAWTAKREMQYARADILKGILETDDDDMQTALDQASAALANMRAAFPVIRERFKGDMALMDEVDSILVKAVVYRDQVFDLVEAKRNEEAFALMKASYIPLLNQISDTLDKISGQAERNAKEKVDQGKRLQRIFMLVVIGIIVLNIILAALLALHISNGIRRPVEEIRTAAEKLASGNLDVSIDYYAEDELGNLSDSIRSLIHIFQGIIGDMGYGLAALGSGDFTVDSKAEELYMGDFQKLKASMDEIIEKLSLMMVQISQSSDQIFAGSSQVSSGAQAVAGGATEQASAVEELAGSINEISAQVSENAQNARHGSKLAETAGIKMIESNREMQELISAMGDISDKSGKIEKVLNIIEDIAFQTKILALNAAVEAAHADKNGKGFAVVANEVRNLAQKSAEASKNTAALIAETIQAVNLGTKLADETANMLAEVVESVKQAVLAVDKISEASSEQAVSIAKVTQSVNQISDVVQNNSATAEESAAASEELSVQAHILSSLVSQFKLK